MAEYTGSIRILRADNEFFGAADLIPDSASDIGTEKSDIPFIIAGADFQERRKVGGKTKANVLALRLIARNGQPCKKEWILNKTNGNAIAAMYGAKVGEWKGKWVWLYVDPRCRSVEGGTVAGIRVRSGKTAAPANAQQPTTPQQQPQPDSDGDMGARE